MKYKHPGEAVWICSHCNLPPAAAAPSHVPVNQHVKQFLIGNGYNALLILNGISVHYSLVNHENVNKSTAFEDFPRGFFMSVSSVREGGDFLHGSRGRKNFFKTVRYHVLSGLPVEGSKIKSQLLLVAGKNMERGDFG